MLGLSDVGIERDDAACATRAVAGHETIQADVLKRYAAPPGRFVPMWDRWFEPVAGVIGSPPCPQFSTAGKQLGRLMVDGICEAVENILTGPVVWPGLRRLMRVEARSLRAHLLAATSMTRREASASAWAAVREAFLSVVPAQWIHATRPEWIALEQVPAVLPIWKAYERALRAQGYSAWCGVLNAADFGVPQTRTRAILLASRTRMVTAPEPTHAKDPQPTLFGELQPWVSMAKALGWDDETLMVGFPRRDDLGTSPDGYRERDWRPAAAAAAAVTEKARSWQVRPARTILGNRQPRWIYEDRDGTYGVTLNTNRDQRPDGSRQTVPSTAPAPAPALTAKSGGQWTFDRPATTVQGDPRVWPPGHKVNGEDEARLGEDEARARYGDRAGSEAIRITVRDALILQSFRPDYPVQGTKTKQFEQIGNAVPPLLAKACLKVVV